jgi:hypothetical protein
MVTARLPQLPERMRESAVRSAESIVRRQRYFTWTQ